jgi:periplasmic divalent cation tolerance protein
MTGEPCYTCTAGKIVKEKLAACVNILPGVKSVYVWEGKEEASTELMLMVRVRQTHQMPF